MNECEIFTAALDLSSPEREAFLDRACAGDPVLRQRVALLLASHQASSNLLEQPAVLSLLTDNANPVDVNSTTEVLDATEDIIRSNVKLGHLGQYRILELIGRGGMGMVFKAHDQSLQRPVAIKMLVPEQAENTNAQKRFLREARAAAAVRHENIVAIHAVEGSQVPYLVMEWIDGASLQKVLEKGPLDLVDIVRFGRQIAAGLSAAHDKGLVHRDIKPANILLESESRVIKITDFGLARPIDDIAITQTGEVTGSPLYMSPEQALGLPVDHRSDLFSLGCVLYFMCTGKSPFHAESVIAVMRRVCDDTPQPIADINAATPPWLADLIMKLLAKNPQDRYQSARQVHDILQKQLLPLEQASLTATMQAAPEIVPAVSTSQHKYSAWRSPLRISAIALILLCTGLAISEGSGYTQITSTVIRIVTGEGTLVIEVNDPAVKVALEGSDVTISGAGVHELRLKPGTYKVTATADGKPVNVPQEVVTINRGGRQLVSVKREPSEKPTFPTIDLAGIKSKWPYDNSHPPPAAAPFDATQARDHQVVWAKALGVPVEFTNALGMKFRLIPPGWFLRGTSDQEVGRLVQMNSENQLNQESISSEAPQHVVMLTKPFYLGVFEVTKAEFAAVSPFIDKPNVNLPRIGLLPVSMVHWSGACLFCNRLSESDNLAVAYQGQSPPQLILNPEGYRLPTAAEWEFACRAGASTVYPFGDSPVALKEYAWFLGNSDNKLHPVGELKPNALGLYDMLGNVAEWCQDSWSVNEYAKFQGLVALDPHGPDTSNTRRVVKGGSAIHSRATACRPAYQTWGNENLRDNHIGLRLVLSVEAVRTLIKNKK